MRFDGVGRGQGAGRRHGAEPSADLPDQRGIRAAFEGRGSARHHPAVGDALLRYASPLRAARGPRLSGARAPRHYGVRDQWRRVRAVGHPRQGARRSGLAAAGRAARRHDAGLCLGRLGWAGPDKIGDELLGYIARGGFGAVKMRVGIIDGDPRHSARRVRAAREALGPAVGLMCDAHGTLSVAEARRFCRLVEECNLAWFEEPVTADDKRGQAEVRAMTDIPIASGESEITRHDFRDLAILGAVDIMQPDLAICGGITEAMRISALASAHNLRLAPHLWAGAP